MSRSLGWLADEVRAMPDTLNHSVVTICSTVEKSEAAAEENWRAVIQVQKLGAEVQKLGVAVEIATTTLTVNVTRATEDIDHKMASTSSTIHSHADAYFEAKRSAMEHHLLLTSTNAAEKLAQQAAIATTVITAVSDNATAGITDGLAEATSAIATTAATTVDRIAASCDTAIADMTTRQEHFGVTATANVDELVANARTDIIVTWTVAVSLIKSEAKCSRGGSHHLPCGRFKHLEYNHHFRPSRGYPPETRGVLVRGSCCHHRCHAGYHKTPYQWVSQSESGRVQDRIGSTQ